MAGLAKTFLNKNISFISGEGEISCFSGSVFQGEYIEETKEEEENCLGVGHWAGVLYQFLKFSTKNK